MFLCLLTTNFKGIYQFYRHIALPFTREENKFAW